MNDRMEDCRETLEELEQFLDGELLPTQRDHVLAHLEKCIECYHAFDLQAEIKQLIAIKCADEPLPPGLLDRIKQSLADVRSTG
jgi:mycothiol system anti-sigma-R factor